MHRTPRFDPQRLHADVVRIWQGLGSTPEESRLLVDHLVAANLAGHDSHGVGMLPDDASSLASGSLKLGRRPEILTDTGVVVTLHVGYGLEQVAAYDAMNLGIERHRQHGAAIVGLRRPHHVGRIGHWAEQCAAAGFASIHLVSVPGDALVAPFGGSAAE